MGTHTHTHTHTHPFPITHQDSLEDYRLQCVKEYQLMMALLVQYTLPHEYHYVVDIWTVSLLLLHHRF